MSEADPKPTEAQPADEAQELSLDKLSNAFAGMLGAPVEEADDVADDQDADAGDQREEAEPAVAISPQSILEAMLFVGSPENRPLSSKQAAELMRGVEPGEVGELVQQLNARYAEDGCPYEIIDDSGGFRLALRQEFGRIRDKFFGRVREARLSQAAIEVLSLVAYNQPISNEEVSQQRGTPSGAILSQLVRRQLLRIERPDTKPRRPVYFTSERFLKLFQLSSLDDLPRSEDLSRQ